MSNKTAQDLSTLTVIGDIDGAEGIVNLGAERSNVLEPLYKNIGCNPITARFERDAFCHHPNTRFRDPVKDHDLTSENRKLDNSALLSS